MPGLTKTLVAVIFLGAVSLPSIGPATGAPQDPPIGAWRTTNGCFLVAFILSNGGRTQTAYMTGEQDGDARWTWDGNVLTIESQTFPEDRFAGHLTNGQLEADYTWHDLDKDELNRQSCVFEKFTPFRL